MKSLIEKFDTDKKNTKFKKLSDISVCLEYILAILRLRKLNNEEYNYDLSLNNPVLRNVYKLLEVMAENKKEFSKIKLFIQVEISNKGDYDYIPDIIYTLLVYISGYSSEGDIKISGVTMEEE